MVSTPSLNAGIGRSEELIRYPSHLPLYWIRELCLIRVLFCFDGKKRSNALLFFLLDLSAEGLYREIPRKLEEWSTPLLFLGSTLSSSGD